MDSTDGILNIVFIFTNITCQQANRMILHCNMKHCPLRIEKYVTVNVKLEQRKTKNFGTRMYVENSTFSI